MNDFIYSSETDQRDDEVFSFLTDYQDDEKVSEMKFWLDECLFFRLEWFISHVLMPVSWVENLLETNQGAIRRRKK